MICDNYEAIKEEIQKDIDKLDAELNLYETTLTEKKITAMFWEGANGSWLNHKQEQLVVIALM